MCTSPKQIQNRNKFFIPGVDKQFVTVPCGRCAECQEQRSDDFLVRMYYDYTFFKKKYPFSSCYFVTLTYNDENIPYFEYADGSRQCCPDFSDVQKCLKQVRSMLNCDFDDVVLRYFCSVEYGKSTGRVHYHLLVYVNQFIGLSAWFHYFNYSWAQFKRVRNIKSGRYEVVRLCSRGFIKPIRIKVNGQERSDLNCFKYIAKYCSKDLYERNLTGSASARVRCSLGFGSSVTFTDQQLKDGYVWLPLGKQGAMKKYLIPQYYYLRLRVNMLDKSFEEEREENARYVESYLDYLNRFNKSDDLLEYLVHRSVRTDYAKELAEFRLYNVAERYVDNMALCWFHDWTIEERVDIEYHLKFDVYRYRDIFQSYSRDDLIEYFVHIRPYISRYRPKYIDKFPDYFWFSRTENNAPSLSFDISSYDEVEKLFIVRDYLSEIERLRRHDMSEFKHRESLRLSFNLKNQKYGKTITDCSKSRHRVESIDVELERCSCSLDKASAEASAAGVDGSSDVGFQWRPTPELQNADASGTSSYRSDLFSGDDEFRCAS